MAFNGSGTYSLPAGNPVVTGTTISSSTTNTTNSDIATALTNCITRDGQSTPSANLPMNAKKLTGLAAGTSAGDSVRYEQVLLLAGGVMTGAITFNAGQTISGYLPTTGGTMTGQLVLPGSSSAIGAVLTSAAEVTTIAATAATGTINYDATTQSVLYYTTSASANWTVNVRASSGTTLDTALAIGQSITLAFMVTQGATAFYNTAVTIDGVSVTPKWQGGTAPTAGNAAGIDVYTYTITKTASATYIVLASLTQFK